MSELNKGSIVYYARIIPSSDIYDLLELKLRTVEDTWFVGIEKRDKQAYFFPKSTVGESIFFDRKDALEKINKSKTEGEIDKEPEKEIDN